MSTESVSEALRAYYASHGLLLVVTPMPQPDEREMTR